MNTTRARNLLHAAIASAWMLALEGYWFLAAERGRVFLYGHLGALPLDARTRSRYWMSGLAAAGLLLAPYLLLALAARRCRRKEPLPDPTPAALLAAVPLSAGALLYACVLGQPRLPLGSGLALALSSSLGVGLVFWCARQLFALGWSALPQMLDGLALAPLLAFFHAVELPARGVSLTSLQAWGAALGSLGFGALALLALGFISLRLRLPPTSARAMLAWACAWTYLAAPALHHLLMTPPGYKYITSADNLFAGSWPLQLLTWGLAAALAWGAQRVRTHPTERSPR